MLTKNPWFSMWFHPRQTIREIITFNPNYRIWILSAIYGLGSLFGIAQSYSLGIYNQFPAILLGAIILSPLWGYIVFSIASVFVVFTGKWIGGHGDYRQIRAALAWSNVPMVINVVIWFLMMILFGTSVFKNFPEAYALSRLEFWLLFSLLITQLIVGVWALILYVLALAEVQMFSILKAIFNLILAFIMVMIVVFVLIYAGQWIYHLSNGPIEKS